jgi:uncharacterized protein involved in exopolysaccharide biosynthesis
VTNPTADLPDPPDSPAAEDDSSSLLDLLLPLVSHWKFIVLGALFIGVLALGVTFIIKPTFTARTSLLPPQQQQSGAMAALASLGGLASLAGSAAGIKTAADQYAALMQSVTIEDRLIDQYKLIESYKVLFKSEARLALEEHTRIAVGKKDGLISVEVDDHDPQRAAEMANQYVDELRRMVSSLAITEAQQRRAFFEAELKSTRDRLAQAQATLQASGFAPGVLRAEPKAAAEGYARLKAEVTGAEVRLQTMRSMLADNTPEVQRQTAMLSSLRGQLALLERASDASPSADYLGKYREFKYQEALFELFSRQYELARLDESREGPLIQVVDVAKPPDMKSKPRRGLTAVLVTLCAGVLLAIFVLQRDAWRRSARDPRVAAKMARLKSAFRPRRQRA